jgi:hypothetical protein
MAVADITDGPRITRALHEEVARSRTSVGRLVRRWGYDCFENGDVQAAAICALPSLVSEEAFAFMDVDLQPGAHYGSMLSWMRESAPELIRQREPVRVVTAIKEKRMTQLFVEWCTARKRRPEGRAGQESRHDVF